jgi:hypothetical protein
VKICIMFTRFNTELVGYYALAYQANEQRNLTIGATHVCVI